MSSIQAEGSATRPAPGVGRPGDGPAGVGDLTVIIVTYETPDHLECCLDALAGDQVLGEARVIVVDNSATDACAAIARAREGVELIRNPRNVGYARAVNQGIRATNTPFVLILNPDIEIEPGSVRALRSVMEREPAAGIAAAKLLNPDRTLQYSCRRFYTFGTIMLRRTFLGRLFPNHRLVREHLMSDWAHDQVRDVDWVLGACLMVRRAAIDEVGPMDERFFLYFEDVDWCARMHHHGWQVLYVPEAVMVHHHRRESARGGYLSRSARIHLASVVRFYEKWSLLLYLLKQKRAAIRVLVLLLADLVALNGAFLAAFGARSVLAPWFAKPLFPVADYWQFLLVYNAVSVLALHGFGLYRAGRPTDPLELLVRVVPSLIIASLAVLVSTFLLYIRAYSRFIVVLNLPLAVAAVIGLRTLLAHLVSGLAERGLAARRVLLVGDRELCRWMAARLGRVAGIRYDVVGTFELVENEAASAVARLRHLCRVERVNELVVGDTHGDHLPVLEAAAALESDGIRVRLVSPLSRALGPGAAIEPMAGVPVVVPTGARGGPGSSTLKRAVDVLVALALLPWVGAPALWVRGIAALGAGSVRAERRLRFTAAGDKAWTVTYATAGSAEGAEPLLAAASTLWDLLRGRLSIVGVGRYAAAPSPPRPACRGVRPGIVTPSGRRPDPEKCLEADQSYVLSWSPATDLRILLKALGQR